MNILDYTNYRQFLFDYVNNNFKSYQQFSDLIGFISNSYVIEVITVGKGLSIKSARRIGKAIFKSKKKYLHFIDLVIEADHS